MSRGTDPNHATEMASDSDPGRAAVASAYQRFEPRAYLRNNYAPPRGDLSSPDGVGPWKLRCMAQTFATGERRKLRHERAEVMREKGGGTRMHECTLDGDQEANLQGLCNQKRASKSARLRGRDRLQSQLPGKLRLEDGLSHGIGDLTRQLRLLFFRGEGA